MQLNLSKYVYGDKVLNHPIIGEISCNGFEAAYNKCYNVVD